MSSWGDSYLIHKIKCQNKLYHWNNTYELRDVMEVRSINVNFRDGINGEISFKGSHVHGVLEALIKQ